MGFLDNLGKAISDVGNSAIQRGKDAANVAKYNRMITDEEKETVKCFEELGRNYYEIHKDHYEEELTDIIDRIRESEAKIESYRNLILELQNAGKCSCCGAELPDGACYCPKCGTKVVIPETHPEEEEQTPAENICPECGQKLEPGFSYCMFCGAKVQSEEACDNSGEYSPDAELRAEDADKCQQEECEGTTQEI